MGKSFHTDLKHSQETINWAASLDVGPLVDFIHSCRSTMLSAVGSGGSLSAAAFCRLLHESNGNPAKHETPFSIVKRCNSFRFPSNVWLFTAGGRNADIIAAAKSILTAELPELAIVCMQRGSPLSVIASDYANTWISENDLPFGKDGFLATNSLLAQMVITLSAYHKISPVENFKSVADGNLGTFSFLGEIGPLQKQSFLVVYGSWSEPAALDLESKMSESGMATTQLCDFRNFAHGRHLGLAINGSITSVIFMYDSTDKDIAAETIKTLPADIHVLRMESTFSGPVATIDLIRQVYGLVAKLGELRGVDPGRPQVPTFGRKLYKLGVLRHEFKPPSGLSQSSILRKCGGGEWSKIPAPEQAYWLAAQQNYLDRLYATVFSAIVLDYDGTICDRSRRFSSSLCPLIVNELKRLLSMGIKLGIATGRGKSAREALQQAVPEDMRGDVTVGYYNGSDIALLSDVNHPEVGAPKTTALQNALKSLQKNRHIADLAEISESPGQVTIKHNDRSRWSEVRRATLNVIFNTQGVRLVESTHSIDVIDESVSKLEVVRTMRSATLTGSVLCIGDKGDWPGNDFELLRTATSLSVDEVSPDPESCWNFAPLGIRGERACLHYLRSLHPVQGGVKFTSGLEVDRSER